MKNSMDIIEKLKNSRMLAVIGLAAITLALFLPYITITVYDSISLSLIEYTEGKIVMIFIIFHAVVIFQDYIKKYVPRFHTSGFNRIQDMDDSNLMLIAASLTVAYAIFLYFQIDVDTAFVNYGIGFWMLWIGILCLMIHAVLHKMHSVKAGKQ